MSFDLLVEEGGWDAPALTRDATRAWDALAEMGLLAGDMEAALLATDDARIATLNTEFRGKEVATNVLSWPSSEIARGADGLPNRTDPDPFLGDIAVAYETCAREAAADAKTFSDHITHLLIHGLLHLLGYDHETDAEAAEMEAIEVKALAFLGIANPY